MKVLLDTNILTAMAQSGHVHNRTALAAVASLRRGPNFIFLVPQVLYEFWSVASRPIGVNGLGLALPMVAAELARLKRIFSLLPDTAAIFAHWENLVTAHNVIGKNAHDARLVAAMVVHGLTHLLTFNTQDFARYPAVTAVDPIALTAPPTTP
jgi:predicted nucleic acid-binding protein